MPEPHTKIEDAAFGRWFAIARILRPRGRQGEVVVEALTDFPSRFEKLKRVFIEVSEGPPQQVNIAETWWHGDRLILRFEGIESISQAKELQGRLVMLPGAERRLLGENQYYLSDLIGCEILSNGRKIGEVVRVEPTGGADLLCVQAEGDGSSEILIPFAEEICPEIDVVGRQIRIEPPEGLLELNEESPGTQAT